MSTPGVLHTEVEIKGLDNFLLSIIGYHQDQLLCLPRNQDPRSLVRHRSRVYSQNGEDGAIAEIFRRVGTTNRFFIEIGAGDGRENNTRFLLELGWHGTWAECDPANVARIRAGYAAELASGQLVLIDAPVTRENVATLLRAHHPAPDLLSIDIDMNTSHVWRALEHLAPRVAVIEYNAAVPPSIEWEVRYDPLGAWDDSNYYGASLKTMERIGTQNGMRLVGCELTGINAYFVRANLASEEAFVAPFTAEQHYEPSRNLPPIGFPPRERALPAAILAAA